jgi:OOP family OmpA-OmpF porin
MMKNCKRFLIAGGVMVLASAFAVTPAAAQGYGGISLGISTSPDFNDLCDFGKSLDPGATCTKSPMGFKLFGGNQFNPNFAVEAGYYSSGDFKVKSAAGTSKVNATAFFGQAVGIMPVQPSFSLFGKIGLHFWSSKLDDPSGVIGNSSDNGTDIVFGFGGKFAVSKTSAIRVEYEQFKASVASETFVVNFLSAGYEMKF